MVLGALVSLDPASGSERIRNACADAEAEKTPSATTTALSPMTAKPRLGARRWPWTARPCCAVRSRVWGRLLGRLRSRRCSPGGLSSI